MSTPASLTTTDAGAGSAGTTVTTAAASPTVSRRHAAGAESARGLLFTVLGEFVLPSGGSAWTSAFIDVLGRLGVEEKASRQALMRTAADGWLASERVGRRTLWSLTPDAERLLTDGAERIYGFRGLQREWDGGWLLVLARVPESDRPTRHLLRTRLGWAGFGSPAPGVWISTHRDRAAEAERVLDEAGVLDEAQIFLAEHRAGELAGMVRQAWDLDAIERSYERFLAEFARRPSRDPLVRVAELVHSWRRFPSDDPELPGELLPAHWSGARAASLFRRQHARWTAAANAEWRRLTEDAG
ncbi:PaaX family transcriptional regulator [Planotetraspora kaengkrachanensis]|uniref:PaaX family transcriptional regulator n=1 Tax=Planotetraspora kaengkrachanensis TaxID=575193 RepID=A0A8J3PT19_9ACTN|nr:PaaX family transcriptional regulator C-terminal domain-containing protein [Planotetraspora kaengkrachanensis]GIG79061.1 PaaX family transcriptional regulator [Planotetraspora kaengkrachanensis]